MANIGSLTAIPRSLALLDRAASGSPPPTPMARRSSPRPRPERSTPSVFATLSTSPDIRTGTWACSRPSLSTNASLAVPRRSIQRLESSELVRQQRLQWHNQYWPQPDQHQDLWQSTLQGQRQLRTRRAQLAALAPPGVLTRSKRLGCAEFRGPTRVQNLAFLHCFRVSHCCKGNRINGT